jgi:hypothetical protein
MYGFPSIVSIISNLQIAGEGEGEGEKTSGLREHARVSYIYLVFPPLYNKTNTVAFSPQENYTD